MAIFKSSQIVGLKSDLGEGTLWDERRRSLLWVDVFKNSINEYDPKTKIVHYHSMPKMVSYIGKRKSGGFVVALGDAIALLSRKFQIEREISLEFNPEQSRSNDGNIDPTGCLWIGSADIVDGAGKGELRRIDTALNSTTHRTGIFIANGTDWSLDGKIMYYIDSATRKISRYEFSPESGAIIQELSPIDVSDVTGVPDGMCTDSLGNLWVAFWGAGQVRNYTPTGELLNVVECPTALITCCSFGGDDLKTLFISSAISSYDPQYTLGDDQDGGIFSVQLPVAGKLDRFFKA